MMLYNCIIIDIFPLIHRKKGKLTVPSKISTRIVDYVDDEIKPHLHKDGCFYFIFDPIIPSDLSINKYFSYHATSRQEISDTYKSGRTKEPVIQKVAEFLYKFYSHRGDSIKVVTSNFLEADDFIEGIIAKHSDENIAIVTNDLDAARFLGKNVFIINKTFDIPITVDSFKKKNGYIPTIASVTLTKAIYGDKSDNIQGVLANKKAIFENSHKKVIDDFIKEIIQENLNLDEVERHLRQGGYSQLVSKKDKSKLEEFKFLLETIPQKENLMQLLLNNIRLIKTRCKNVDKYIKSGKNDPIVNLALDNVVGRNLKSGNVFRFGAYNDNKEEKKCQIAK
jgi:Rad3-related DNA helicase